VKHQNIIDEFKNLAIIVVNYNLKNDTIECLQSLISANAKIEQIIVIDNCSSDGSVEGLRDEFGPCLEIIIAPENKGYPHALNIGIPRAIEKGAQWVLLMNNDTYVAPDFISELHKSTINYPEYALLGPMILYHEEPDTIWYLGYRVVPGTLIGVGSYRGHVDKGQFPPIVPIDFMHGCAMMVRSDVFQKIGLFDDTHLIYGDDADFSWRAKLAGYKLAAAPNAKMWHKIARTMGKQKPRTRYLRFRNTIFFYRRYAKGFKRFIMFCFTVCKMTITIVYDIYKRQFTLIPPLFWGWVDGWLYQTKIRYS